MLGQQHESKSRYAAYACFILLCTAERTSASRAGAMATTTKLCSSHHLDEQDVHRDSHKVEKSQNAIELVWLFFEELEWDISVSSRSAGGP